MISPVTRERVDRSPLLGFDTEYDSKTHKLISFQLGTEEEGFFYEAKRLSIDRLARAAREHIGAEESRVVLAAYFSIAELQHLPVIEESVEVHSFGSSIDVEFYSRRYELLIRVFDLARFFDRSPLSKVAESYGLKKIEGINRTRVTAASARSAKFRKYAKHDAILCAQIAGKLRAGFAPDRVDPIFEGSPASSAACAFRRELTKPIKPPSTRVRLMGMLCTWGGRAEALERGRYPELHEFDLVSAYPRAAISFGEFPTDRDWYALSSPTDPKSIGGVLRVRFKFPPSCLYPCLPVFTRKLQIYPLEGESFCTLDETRTAVKLGAKLSLVEGFGFKSGLSLLPDYMRRVTGERKKTEDPVRRTALKLLSNSLIGKLAQRVVGPEIEDLIELARQKGLALGTVARLTREEAVALGLPLKVRLGSMFMPEWNALITGRVRAILGAAIVETQAVYASTDAIWTRRAKPPKNYLGGDWEYKRSGPAIVARTRLARIGEHVAHHSIWKRDAGIEVLEQVDSADVPVSYSIERPIKLKESIGHGQKFGKWVKEKREASARWDNKRKLSEDGSAPWRNADEYLATASLDTKARRRNPSGGSSGEGGGSGSKRKRGNARNGAQSRSGSRSRSRR